MVIPFKLEKNSDDIKLLKEEMQVWNNPIKEMIGIWLKNNGDILNE